MTTQEIISKLRLRDVHIRQYLATGRFELWADGRRQGEYRSPLACESAVRKLLGFTNEEGVAVERELARLANVS